MPTVALDLDGVLHAYSRGWHDGTIYDGPAPGALDAVRELMADYAVYVLTTRDPHITATWIEEQLGIPTLIDPGGNGRFWNDRGMLLVTNRKLPAIAYVDDRGVHHTGDWAATIAAVKELDPS